MALKSDTIGGFRKSPEELSAGIRLLIVEDEIIIAASMQNALQYLGYTVVDIVTTGEEAIEKAVNLRPDVVLMDVRLGGDIDGVDAAVKIRARQNTPILYMTGFSDAVTLGRIRDKTPNCTCITKPVEPLRLHDVIQTLMAEGHARCCGKRV